MPLRTREPGAKDIGYLKYLARRYNFADGLMFAALRELEIYYLLHTPLDHRFVQEMGFNGRRGQRVPARFDGIPETAVCPYELSFRDYLEFEMVRNTDVYVQLPGLDTAEHTTVFKSDNRRATKRCARDVRLESDEAYVWVRDLLLHGISPYSVSSALTRAGYKVSKDSGVITRAIHEIHSSLMTPGGKAELQRIMAETPTLGKAPRSPLVRPEERIITPPSSLRGIPGETISFTGLDGEHYNYAYKCVTNITEFFNIFEVSYFKYLYETYADHGAILDYIALYTPRAGFAGITPLLNGTHINIEMWQRTTGTNNCPYPIPFEAVYNTEKRRILTHEKAQNNTTPVTTPEPAPASLPTPELAPTQEQKPATTSTVTTHAPATHQLQDNTLKEKPAMNHTIGESAAKGKNTTPATFTHRILTHPTANNPANLTLGALADALGVTTESLVAVFSD